jgi:hypothetical protein
VALALWTPELPLELTVPLALVAPALVCETAPPLEADGDCPPAAEELDDWEGGAEEPGLDVVDAEDDAAGVDDAGVEGSADGDVVGAEDEAVCLMMGPEGFRIEVSKVLARAIIGMYCMRWKLCVNA